MNHIELTYKKKYISFSGGVESTAMCILYGKGATAIWCDTGIEEEEMYKRIDYVEKRLKEIHKGDFTLVRIKPSVKVKGELVSTIEEAAFKWKIFPSKMRRWCTNKFKIEPIAKYLFEQGECELMVGFNVDEEDRYLKAVDFFENKNIKYTYPLYEDGLSRNDCKDILKIHGLQVELPIYMNRGGCRWCFFKSKNEIKAKYIFNREEFMKDLQFEVDMNKHIDSNKFYAINISMGSYQSIKDECDVEISLWGIDAIKDMYSKVESSTSCGAFCHR